VLAKLDKDIQEAAIKESWSLHWVLVYVVQQHSNYKYEGTNSHTSVLLKVSSQLCGSESQPICDLRSQRYLSDFRALRL
jgi:hypothetical protein